MDSMEVCLKFISIEVPRLKIKFFLGISTMCGKISVQCEEGDFPALFIGAPCHGLSDSVNYPSLKVLDLQDSCGNDIADFTNVRGCYVCAYKGGHRPGYYFSGSSNGIDLDLKVPCNEEESLSLSDVSCTESKPGTVLKM